MSSYDTNFRTIDGGITWELLNNLGSVVDMDAVSENVIITVNHPEAYSGENPVTEFAISKSIDLGITWDGNFRKGGHLESVHFQNDSVGFVAGDFSIIMKTENCGGDIIGDYPWNLFTNTKEILVGHLNIFPNPVTNYLVLNPAEQYHNWDYLIESFEGIQYGNGKINDSKLNTSDLPNGIYILRLSKDNEVKVGKFVKM